MARNFLYIKNYVEQLLQNNLKKVDKAHQHLSYGYTGEREVYKDPVFDDKQVVVVNNEQRKPGRVGQPNVIEEANNFIDNLAAAAESLIDKDNNENKALIKEAKAKLAAKFKIDITAAIDHTKATGDLFSSKKSLDNKNFLKELEKAKKILSLYAQAVAKISGYTLKELEKEGHQVRSQHRDTMIHRFIAPHAKVDEEQFVIYIPCSRYTKRQQRLMGAAEHINRDHDTTSHNRANLVLGNSSMARMIAGTRHANGTVTIYHDSFTGPGARMPYSDFKGADKYTKLAIKAVTLINQEETIQTLAQRQIDRMTNDELLNKIPHTNLPNDFPNDEIETRRILIELYLTYNPNPLAVTECYTQVVTAGQKLSAENQKEQFEYVCEMMDAFDGAKASVSIQTGSDTEYNVDVDYQARMGSWGVNWFRQVSALSPLSDNAITQDQNTRFMNEMSKDVIENLGKSINELAAYDKVNSLFQLIQGPSNLHPVRPINKVAYEQVKTDYRQALFDYFEAYKNQEDSSSQETLDELKRRIESLEYGIRRLRNAIYEDHRQIEDERKEYYDANKDRIGSALDELRKQFQPILALEEISPETKSKLQHFYNSAAYLFHAQELYYDSTWHQTENNFKLQTLMATLAEELDFANTKGCKSNNDRGQRLAQKIVGNALWTKMSEEGLYTRQFLNQHRTHNNDDITDIETLDRELTTIQTLHHTANTGVSGGKFSVKKGSFADNGLFGNIASLAKIDAMKPDNALTKNLKWKMGFSAGGGIAVIGIVLALALLFPPAGLFIAGTGISLALFTTVVAAAYIVGSFLIGAAITTTQNFHHDHMIQSLAQEGLQDARTELASRNVEQDSNGFLIESLGIDTLPKPSDTPNVLPNAPYLPPFSPKQCTIASPLNSENPSFEI